jgi:hypothetical protein
MWWLYSFSWFWETFSPSWLHPLKHFPPRRKQSPCYISRTSRL